MTYTGGCQCRAIRYEISAEPLMAVQCQCRACQYDTGTGHISGMAFPKPAVKMTGKASEFSRPADSGGRATKGFCGNCGSPVYGGTSRFPEMIMIQAGSLDDPSAFKPQMLVYAECGQPWDQIDSKLPRFPKMPPM
jgi:hypothetical protein